MMGTCFTFTFVPTVSWSTATAVTGLLALIDNAASAILTWTGKARIFLWIKKKKCTKYILVAIVVVFLFLFLFFSETSGRYCVTVV